MDSMPSPSCHCTCSLTEQGAEELTLHFTAALNAREGYVHKAVPSFPNTSKGVYNGDQHTTFNLEKAGNEEVGVSITHCSSQGYYNPANSYFRMIDKTQSIQLCRMGKMN